MTAVLALETSNDVRPAGTLPPASQAGEFAVMVGQFALLVLVLLAVASEYANGAIGSTLQWTPRRSILLVARTIVPVAAATLVGTLLTLIADVVAWAIFPSLELSLPGLAGSLATVAGVLAAGSLIAVGVALLLRSTAAALAFVFMVLLVLPAVLPGFGVEWMKTVAELLPGSGAAFFLVDAPPITTGAAVALLAAWAAGATAIGGASLVRRDAT